MHINSIVANTTSHKWNVCCSFSPSSFSSSSSSSSSSFSALSCCLFA